MQNPLPQYKKTIAFLKAIDSKEFENDIEDLKEEAKILEVLLKKCLVPEEDKFQHCLDLLKSMRESCGKELSYILHLKDFKSSHYEFKLQTETTNYVDISLAALAYFECQFSDRLHPIISSAPVGLKLNFGPKVQGLEHFVQSISLERTK